MMTINNIKALFQNIADAHYQVQDYGFGRLFEINNELKPGIIYPCLWVVPVSSVTTEQTQQRTFNILALARLDKDKNNRDESWSDCEQILNDVIKILRNESDDYTLIGDPVLEPFDEAHGDWLVGWGSQVVIETEFNNNYCDVPSSDITSPNSPSGYGIIKNQLDAIIKTLNRSEVYYVEELTEIQQTLETAPTTITQQLS
jgi:hypothetical protein